ncbi:DNA polymerase III subunit epsilon [Candidatus Symbiobacter mobilis]|nr:DNA polymerase III subunit epsilon [Candidatus Symbiobacter mobilis]
MVFLDTETTGLSPDQGDRIVEIACVEVVQRKKTGKHFHRYVNPERDIQEGALRVHGITSEFLQDKPVFAQIAEELLAYLRGADVYIHNAPFDTGFLDMELARIGKTPLKSWVASITDTLAMARDAYPGKRNSLDALCDRLEVDRSGRSLHGALLDAELLADVTICMTRGQNVLAIQDAAHGPGHAAIGVTIDFRGLDLPIVYADEAERAAHEEVLCQIDKASKGGTVWRKVEPAFPH